MAFAPTVRNWRKADERHSNKSSTGSYRALCPRTDCQWFAVCFRPSASGPSTGEVVGTTIEEQTKQVLKNIEGILHAAGVDFSAVVKTTCFLQNMADFTTFNEVYATAFTEPYPARSAVEVARLPKEVLVEIEVIAKVE